MMEFRSSLRGRDQSRLTSPAATHGPSEKLAACEPGEPSPQPAQDSPGSAARPLGLGGINPRL